MDSLCQRLDQLTISYLEEFGHLLTCKQLLDDTIKQGYFSLSHARVIMGVNNLSRLQFPEQGPMTASTKISISTEPFEIEKETDQEHSNDALKWFGLFSPKVLKNGQKSFQQTIDLALEACRRREKVLQLKTNIEQLLREKQTFLTKENLVEEKLVD